MLNEQDQLRFMRLWTAAQPAVSGYVRSLVRNRSMADEVLQETSHVLFRRFDEYDEQRPFVAWALGVARFQVLSLNRDAARSRVAFDTELLVRFTETWGELAPGASDRSLFLQDCIQRLAARARQMVRLRYYDELTTSRDQADRWNGGGCASRSAAVGFVSSCANVWSGSFVRKENRHDRSRETHRRLAGRLAE